MTMEFFRDLYTDSSDSVHYPIRGCFPELTAREVDGIAADVHFSEVRKALFDLGCLKAPRSDGYQAIFFQSQWETVSQSVLSLIS